MVEPSNFKALIPC